MKPFTALVPAILLLACLALPSTALESKFLTVTQKTISLDMSDHRIGHFSRSRASCLPKNGLTGIYIVATIVTLSGPRVRFAAPGWEGEEANGPHSGHFFFCLFFGLTMAEWNGPFRRGAFAGHQKGKPREKLKINMT